MSAKHNGPDLIIEIRCRGTKKQSLPQIKRFIKDLEWVGGCRDPNEDPMFDSLEIHTVKVRKF